MEKCIKGVLVAPLAERVKRLSREGALDRAALEKWLDPDDFALLDAPVLPGSWYPVAAQGRLLAVLRDVRGGGRDEYLVEMGRRAARDLQEAGTYHQFELAQRSGQAYLAQVASRSPDADPGARRAGAEAFFRRSARRVKTLYQLFYDFGKLEVAPLWRGDTVVGYEVQMLELDGYPEELRHTNTGFHEVLGAMLLNGPTSVTNERPAPDRILIRVERVKRER